MKKEKSKLEVRIYNWSLDIIRLTDKLSHSISNDVIARQIVRSGTSVCANYIEAQGASSKKDFINYFHIALKSANESKYWLGVLSDLKKVDSSDLEPLIIELQEIANMLAASILTLKHKE